MPIHLSIFDLIYNMYRNQRLETVIAADNLVEIKMQYYLFITTRNYISMQVFAKVNQDVHNN
jgi:hypothetical protein